MCFVCNYRAVKIRYSIFRQLFVKMFHLLAAYRQDVASFGEESCVICMCVQLLCCQDVLAASCHDVASFGKESCVLHVCVCVHVHCVCSFHAVKCSIYQQFFCQDVEPFSSLLSRFSIFWQFLVKMFRLMARKVAFYSLCMCCFSCCYDVRSFGSVSMHLSAAEEVLFYSV